ncbi:hypothetical protein AABB24_035867, partial [Solanum stoloniferum]
VSFGSKSIFSIFFLIHPVSNFPLIYNQIHQPNSKRNNLYQPQVEKSSIMATSEILQTEQDLLMMSSLFDDSKGQNVKSRGFDIEKKIEFLESLAGKVSNRRTRRWLNDRLLMELVPRLNAEEIRGLFAPPPFGDDVPLSVFCMTNVEEWDKFRNIDMDKEQCVRAFVKESDRDVLVLRVQDPFQRLLLHGVCEFYNVISVTTSETEGSKAVKSTRITKKKAGSIDLPNITLCDFLKMAKEGSW